MNERGESEEASLDVSRYFAYVCIVSQKLNPDKLSQVVTSCHKAARDEGSHIRYQRKNPSSRLSSKSRAASGRVHITGITTCPHCQCMSLMHINAIV